MLSPAGMRDAWRLLITIDPHREASVRSKRFPQLIVECHTAIVFPLTGNGSHFRFDLGLTEYAANPLYQQ